MWRVGLCISIASIAIVLGVKQLRQMEYEEAIESANAKAREVALMPSMDELKKPERVSMPYCVAEYALLLGEENSIVKKFMIKVSGIALGSESHDIQAAGDKRLRIAGADIGIVSRRHYMAGSEQIYDQWSTRLVRICDILKNEYEHQWKIKTAKEKKEREKQEAIDRENNARALRIIDKELGKGQVKWPAVISIEPGADQ